MQPWFLKSFKALVITVGGLIVLGGSVRVMNAGLACPDWPLCFGNLIPDFHPQVYFEFIHRVVAGTVSIVTIALQIILFRNKSVPSRLKVLGGLSLALLGSQVVLGGLTVLLQLKSGIVAAHLGIGTAFFAVLFWMSLDLQRLFGRPSALDLGEYGVGVRTWARLVLAAVYGQLLLGGLVASNYAALACTEFPKCQGEWFPPMIGAVGLHMLHRFGAYSVGLIVVANALIMSRGPIKNISLMMLGFVLLQICLGVANVIFYTPPLLAVLHLAVGIKIFYLAIRQSYLVSHASVKVYAEPYMPNALSRI